ncbi:hypothetical protein [Stutzerimonas xanthomarina]|uniref:DUF2188 domain-containing protein n=2 Tax=Stutzerimonas xanthomarina TaxID=271420 RepID=A0A1M5SIN7_9GAMM|nr:hypothetical protein [Stutzerimonas xanthomarina]MCP9339095.1 hypothetical protein [Stutzerimonas xanthomarina]SEI01051.1 hypothetical protein SAMN05216535_3358 [Stutzerimonas xanthomarina]SHH38414.1 hypothetical protein SAMN02744645_3507 [Stutzerimonas xanthomarina DSM 18231]
MDKYHVNPTPMGWELTDQQSQETVLRTLTKDEMFTGLDSLMEGKTASVEVYDRNGTLEEERPYPGSSHPVSTR